MKTSTYVACMACLPTLVSYVTAQETDPGVLTVEQISKVPKEIISCKFNYRFHDLRKDRVLTRTIAVDGDKFFIDVGNKQAGFDSEFYWLTDGIGFVPKQKRQAFRFDGEFYWLKVQARPITRKENDSFLGFKQLDTHPLNAPYAWVWGDTKLACWSDLRKEETWRSVGKRMRYQATLSIRNQTCDVFVVDYPESEQKYTVAFSRRLGGFPIHMSLEIKSEHFSTADVLETHRVAGVVIATKGQAKNKFRNEPIEWIDVDVDSIQVNESIDPAIFRP